MSPGSVESLFDRFLAAAARAPERPAFTFLDAALRPTPYTFARLFARVEEIARNLTRHPIRSGTPVGLLLRTQEAQTLHYLAALRVGLTPAILTPPHRKLNRAYYLETTRALLERCRFGAIVTDLDDLGVETPSLRPFSLEGRIPRDVAPSGEVAEAAFLQFSSGTTGIKRGVLVTHEAVLRQLDTYGSAIGLTPEDVLVSWLPLYHDMGFIACLNMPLAFGVHTVVMDPVDWVTNPATFVQAIARYRGTLSWNPNFAYAFMAARIDEREARDADLSSVRGLVNCSEPVTRTSQERFLARFRPSGLRDGVFWGCYAMAETTFALTHGFCTDPGTYDHQGPVGLPPRPPDEPFVSVGRALEGVELIVVEGDGRPRGDREVGELWARSPFNLTGYYNNPEATREALTGDGWYRTGDLGYTIGERFFVCGRKKDLLIVGGVNIYPQDVEALVSQVEPVLPGRVVAFARPSPEIQTEQVVILAESTAPPADQLGLLVEIRQRVLAAFQITNFEVHFVPPGWLVKSSAGKIARSANRRKWEERQVMNAERQELGRTQGNGKR